ncbi:MAG TPA: prolyl oligopeptidase family serine peptidase [Burkholderiales bacterium]|jgi:polyhydroxybutyrate depolymerase
MKMTLTKLAGLALLAVLSGPAGAAGGDLSLNYGDRTLYVHVPSRLPPEGSRALVVVLHGGLGNAEHIVSRRAESGLNMDAAADKYGFIVAYLNGTPVARMLGDDKKGWNAGECCGLSSANNVDDVRYISGAVQYLARSYGIDPERVYGMGHSNGAMMVLRLMCETDLFAAAVPVSGALEIEARTCPPSRGKGILAIRGAGDENVPMAGGKGKGVSRTNFRSQEYTRQAFVNSGARYTLQVLPGAEHRFETIDSAMEKAEGIGIAEKAARFFGLSR